MVQLTRGYTPSSNMTPSSSPAALSSAGSSCQGGSGSYTSYTTENVGTANNDPVYTHSLSLVKAHIVYRNYTNGPQVIESRV